MGKRRHILRFLAYPETGGFVLVACAAAALILANNGLTAGFYQNFLAAQSRIAVGPFVAELARQDWIKEGLMTIFFFVVGLELKNEFVAGELADRRAALLPVAAALGGMIAPAVIYYVLNSHEGLLALHRHGDPRGWPVPVATDIAFATAALAVVGRGLPGSLRIFLLTLAIVDDLGAVVLIAILYSVNAPIALVPLIGVGAMLVVMLLLGQARAPAWLFLPFAVLVWAFALKSGINTSVAGVAAAFTVPVKQSTQLQKALRWFSDYVVLPVFALAAAGVPLNQATIENVWSYVPVGIAAGLVLGKPVGVIAASVIVVALRLARYPTNATAAQFFGVACLCGIGFTMSLFVAALAFDGDHGPGDLARLGIMMGSMIALFVGGGVLAAAKRQRIANSE